MITLIAETMIKLNGNKYDNWRGYFRSKFEATKQYHCVLEKLHGEVIEEKYVPFDKYNKTEIKIGYLGETLIYWKFENPMAPGYNRQQELEYFYRHWFDTSRSYGDPGLELNEINIQAIDKLLCEGLKGKEVQYYNNKQLIKSKLYIHYGNDQDAVSSTIHFSKKGIVQKFLNFFARSDKQVNIQINEIDLANVFNGLKIS